MDIRKYLRLLFLLIFICNYSVIAEIKIDKNNHGFSISLENLDYSKYSDNNNSFLININNSDERLFTDSLGNINALFALPIGWGLDTNCQFSELKQTTDEVIFYMPNINHYPISIEKKGIERATQIYLLKISPFYINGNNIYYRNNIAFNLKYKQELTPDFGLDKYSYINQNILNSEYSAHIRYISDNNRVPLTSSDKKDNKLFYDTNSEYVKILTNYDGVTYVLASEIIALNPKFSGINLKNILLLHKDNLNPYFSNDKNGIFDLSDTIYFLGKRAYDVNTWFDSFNNNSVFYLTYSITDTNKMKLTKMTDITVASDTINSVNYLIHIEKDSAYSYGSNSSFTPTSSGEGWGHRALSAFRDSSIYLNFNFSPIDSEYIKVKTHSYIKSNDMLRVFNHRLTYNFNSSVNDTLSFKYLNGIFNLNYSYFASSAAFVCGTNILNLKSLGFRNASNKIYENDQLIYDFLELEGKAKPLANNGFANFKTDYLENPSNIKINGFNQKQVYVIDSVNSLYNVLQADKGTHFLISSKGKSKYTSIKIDDTLIVSSKAEAYYIAFFELGAVKSYSYTSEQYNDFINQYNSIPTNTVFGIALNVNNLPSQIKSLLNSINSKYINFYRNDSSYTAVIKKSSSIISESMGENSNTEYFNIDVNGNKYSLSFNLPGINYYDLYFTDRSALKKSEVEFVYKSDLKSSTMQCNVLVIANREFKDFAEKYVEIKKVSRPDLKLSIAYIDDIEKEFSYGYISPSGIKDFITYGYSNWGNYKLRYVTIVGDASWDPRKVLHNSTFNNYVISYGVPTSDSWYGMVEGNDVLPDITVGRIPIKDTNDANNYLEKLIKYENYKPAPWQSTMLFLSGGKNLNEMEYILSYQESNMNIVEKSAVCINTELIKKKNPGEFEPSAGLEIVEKINNGEMFVNFIGHGSALLLDLDGWTPEALDNYGKYGFLNTVACNTGAYALPNEITRNESYLFSKEKGFIAVMGASAEDNVHEGGNVAANTLKYVCSPAQRNMADSYNQAKSYSYNIGISDDMVMFHYSYLGDPLLRIPIDTTYRFYMTNQDISVRNNNNLDIVSVSDTFAYVSAILRNFGIKTDIALNIQVIDEFKGIKVTNEMMINGICPSAEFVTKFNISKEPGIHNLTIILDPSNNILTNDIADRTYTKQYQVFDVMLLPIEPMPYWDKKPNELKFRFLNPQISENTEYYFNIFDNAHYSGLPIYTGNKSEISTNDIIVDWKPELTLENNKNYYLQASYKIDGVLTPSSMLKMPFSISENGDNTFVNSIIKDENLNMLSKTNIEYDTNTKSLQFNIDTIDYYLDATCGWKFSETEKRPRSATMIMNKDLYYLTTPPDQVGFHLIHFDKSFNYIDHKYYDTWSSYVSDKDGIKDSSSINLVKYLRDTVKTEDYIFLATLGQSFRIPSLHIKLKTCGSWDTLKTVLSDYYGSVLADSIDKERVRFTNINRNDWGISFCLAAQKGQAKGTANEALDIKSDTARVSGQFKKYYLDGGIKFELGPGKMWNYLKLCGENISKDVNNSIKVYGNNALNTSKQLIKTITNSDSVYLSDINSTYQYLYFDIGFAKTNIEPYYLKIDSIKAYYQAGAEIAILNSKTEIPDSLLIAAQYNIKTTVKNLSLRTEIDSATYNILVNDEFSIIEVIDTTIYNLYPDNTIDFNHELVTDAYPYDITITPSITPYLPDYYYFNNKYIYQRAFVRDTVSPTVLIELDGREVSEGDYVSIQPKFKITLLDNSPRIVNNEDNLQVRLNGELLTSTKYCTDYNFYSLGKNTPAKAVLEFLPDSLDFNDNIIKVFFEDTYQNKATLEIRVNVSKNGSIKELLTYPNPFDANSNISFEYRAPALGGSCLIEFFNYTGLIINSMEFPINIGKNEFPIQLTDQDGKRLPIGVYFYRITIKNTEVFVEPVIDKFLIVR